MIDAKLWCPLCGQILIISEGNTFILHFAFCILHSSFSIDTATPIYGVLITTLCYIGYDSNRYAESLCTHSCRSSIQKTLYRAVFMGNRLLPSVCFTGHRLGKPVPGGCVGSGSWAINRVPWRHSRGRKRRPAQQNDRSNPTLGLPRPFFR